jgi:arylsulfatase A-like enzyme
MGQRLTLRRSFTTIIVALVGAIAGGGPAERAAAAKPPHIVMIMVDDLNVPMIDAMLTAGLLPNIKARFIDSGVRFGASFVTNSLCCPSRATYLTGRYSHNHGVLRNNPPGGSVTAFDDSSTIATWLSAAGYSTVHVGKYLNGYGNSEEAPATSPVNPSYIPPGWGDWHALVGQSAYQVFNYKINHNGAVAQYGRTAADYQTAVLSDIAVNAIGQALKSGRPLFLNIATLAPHFETFTLWAGIVDGAQYPDLWSWYIRPDPRDQFRKPSQWNYIFQTLTLLSQQKPSFNQADVTGMPAGLQKPLLTDSDITAVTRQFRMAAASMLAVDDLVGAVVRALGGQARSTVFFFTSDNGYLYGEHRLGGKEVAYEESIRVPLYVAGSGVVGARTVQAIVLSNDLAPTIAALAGATPSSPVDGRSLVSILAGTTIPADWRRRFLVEHLASGPAGVPTYAAVRTGDADTYPSRLYAEYFANAQSPSEVTHRELYDLTADPFQIANQSTDPARAGELAALTQQLAALRSCGPTSAPCAEVER